MSQKVNTYLFLSMMSVIFAIIISSAYAETDYSKIPIMSQQEREHLFSQVPNFQNNNINYFFEIIITPAGFQEKNVILNEKNYTALKNNVGFFTACGGFNNGLCQPPIATFSAPTTNYCPLALNILLNQDTYISKLYNATSGKDLTNYVYPQYCHAETGPNPINGDASIPEFPMISGFIIAISITTVIIFGRLRK